VKAAYWEIFDDIDQPPGQAAVDQATRRAQRFAARYQGVYPAAVACLTSTLEELTVHLRFPREHWPRIRHTDESFKAGVALSAGWDGVSLLGGRGRPRSEEQVLGLGALPRSLPLEGPTVAPQWWRPRPLRSGRHRGLVAGRFGCQSATSWR
jgi:hypothetical protein